MSASSRAREYSRRYLHGFPTLAAFRAWQAVELPRWLATYTTPSMIAANCAVTEFAWENGGSVPGVNVPDDSPAF